MKLSPNLNLDNTPLLTCGPFLRFCKSNVKHSCFMYITSTCIHLDQWKSFMKIGIKKSHEMISYNLSWIASTGEWEHGMLTKPCYLAQMTLIEFYHKRHEGFVLSQCQENVSIGLKLQFKVYCDAAWPRSNNSVETSYEVWPLIKVEVLVEYNKLYFWTKS